MICPKCGNCKVKVVDSIPSAHDLSLYRRRKCPACGVTFRTIEILDDGSKAFQEGYTAAMAKKSPFSRINNDRRHLCDSSK